MLTREEGVDAHALRRQGWTISAIARHLGRDRKTIRAYLNGDHVPGQSTSGPGCLRSVPAVLQAAARVAQ
ncbi:terminase gpP N-terminus-related DNA-binding protein [Streptomyces hydrogenans]